MLHTMKQTYDPYIFSDSVCANIPYDTGVWLHAFPHGRTIMQPGLFAIPPELTPYWTTLNYQPGIAHQTPPLGQLSTLITQNYGRTLDGSISYVNLFIGTTNTLDIKIDYYLTSKNATFPVITYDRGSGFIDYEHKITSNTSRYSYIDLSLIHI